MVWFRHPGRKKSVRRRAGRGLFVLKPCLLLGLLGAVVAVQAYLPGEDSLSNVVAQPPIPNPGAPAPPAAPATAHPMDEPLRLLNEAAQTNARVQDYTCTLISQERVRGKLLPQNVMQLSFRAQPFSVYMRWAAPQDAAGREVCFVKGRNGDKMRVHEPTGIASRLGFISIDPRDPRVMEHSRHTIMETGMGVVMWRLQQDWTRSRQTNKTQVRIAEYQYDNRPCVRVETIALERNPQEYCYRSVIYFDKQNHMPVRTECYDWPRPGGPAEGDLLETFSYVGLRFNVGLADAVFNH
jgi:hypothetical protein